ncbi:hypothetical protein CRM22_006042 [Opisthorchis felineus]|uniref:Uncharacterized protein n=1 Tax=Opisthorchis felineus TaxID=147828 RepID=A0A4S2LPK3_OPIFE|nr:hypothetical protein CRM22_006042 [Opisthorchis felineus]
MSDRITCGSMRYTARNLLRPVLDILVISTYLVIFTLEDVEATSGAIKLSFNPASDKVHLGAPLVVRCEHDAGSGVDNAASMFLHCPIAPWGAFCFQNCKSACVGEAPGSCPYEKQLGGVTCRTVVTQTGHVTYEYTIQRLTRDWLGTLPSGEHKTYGFYCKSAGSQTPEVWLYEGRPEITNHVTVSVKPPMPSGFNLSSKENGITTNKSGRPVSRDLPAVIQTALEIHTSAIIRELLVICAIVTVFISVSINVFCCIRCALIRKYSKSKRPPRMQHMFCMATEIHNARVARLMAQSHGWNDDTTEALYRNPQRRFEQSSVGSDSRILTPQQLPHVMEFANLYQQHQQLQQQSAISETNSVATANADVHIQSAKNGQIVSPTMTGSAFSITPPMNYGLPGAERQARTASMILLQGPDGSHQPVQPHFPPNQHLAAAVANYCFEQQQNLKKLQEQVIGSEFPPAVHPGSDSLGSCQNSMGNPDSSVLEQYQLSSSGMNTLRRGDPTLMMSSQTGQQGVRSSVSHADNIKPHQALTEQPHPQACLQTPGTQVPVGLLYQAPGGRVQLMGSSQPQLGTVPAFARLNNSTSNPTLIHTFVPLVAGASQSDSGTGSGSGHLSASGQPAAPSSMEHEEQSVLFCRQAPYNGLMVYPSGRHMQYFTRSKVFHGGAECFTEDELSNESRSLKRDHHNKPSVEKSLPESTLSQTRVPSV